MVPHLKLTDKNSFYLVGGFYFFIWRSLYKSTFVFELWRTLSWVFFFCLENLSIIAVWSLFPSSLNRAGQIRLLGGAFQLIQWWAWIKQEWLPEYPSPASLQLQLARRAVMAQVCTVGTLETRSCNLLIWSKATDVNLSDTINATTSYLMMTGTYSRYRLSMLLTISLDDYWNVFPLDLLCFSLERDRPFTLTKKRHE